MVNLEARGRIEFAKRVAEAMKDECRSRIVVDPNMKRLIMWPAGLALAFAAPAAADAADLSGLWRFDIVNSGRTTLGAMTIHTMETVEHQADAQR